MVRGFFFPSLAHQLLQSGLNRPAWLFYQAWPCPGSVIGILRGEKQAVGSAALRGGSGAQVSACPLSCSPLPQPLLQPLLWEYCRAEAGKHHEHIWPSGTGNVPPLQAEGDPENKGAGWLDAAAWAMATSWGDVSTPFLASYGQTPCDFGEKWSWLYPVVINDSLTLSAAMTS